MRLIRPLIFIVLLTSSIFADSCCDQFIPKQCCPSPDACCLPPLPCDENLFQRCKRIVADVEFLYWSVEEGALDYAIVMENRGWAPAADPLNYANGKMQRASYDWDPGVRVSIGYYNAPKFWELFAEYTYYSGRGSDSASAPSGAGLFLNGTFPQLSDNIVDNIPLASAKSSIDLTYQLADIAVARIFDPNPHLRIRMYAGITSSFIDQDWDVTYTDTSNNETKIKNDWCYTAGGFRAGVATDWWWGCNFYISGKASLAGFLGKYENKAEQTTNYIPSSPSGFDINAKVRDLKYEDYRFAQQFQFVFGPSWQQLGKCVDVEVFAGYEFNGWFNLQEVYRSTNGLALAAKETWLNTGALALHGLTVRLSLGF